MFLLVAGWARAGAEAEAGCTEPAQAGALCPLPACGLSLAQARVTSALQGRGADASWNLSG